MRHLVVKNRVVLYGSGSSAGSYFYRELIKDTKNYRTRKIENVINIDEAAEAAVEIAFSLNKESDVSIIFDKGQSNSQSRLDVTTSQKKLLIEDRVSRLLNNQWMLGFKKNRNVVMLG